MIQFVQYCILIYIAVAARIELMLYVTSG